MRTHKTEFPETAIPATIQTLVGTGQLVDVSWHNDAGPSFDSAATGRTLWVHAEGASTEYAVMSSDEGNERSVLIETNDLADALAAVFG
jgi:hypothetical protein